MELFDLKSTPVLNVQRFTSFEEFRPTDVTGAAQNCVVLDHKEFGAVRNAVGIWLARSPGNMKVSFQAARSIG